VYLGHNYLPLYQKSLILFDFLLCIPAMKKLG